MWVGVGVTVGLEPPLILKTMWTWKQRVIESFKTIIIQ